MFREGYLDSGARPLLMGSDFSGAIESVGEEVYGYKLLGNGTYAEFASVRSRSSTTAKLIGSRRSDRSFPRASMPCSPAGARR